MKQMTGSQHHLLIKLTRIAEGDIMLVERAMRYSYKKNKPNPPRIDEIVEYILDNKNV